jgi:hypothetical protein
MSHRPAAGSAEAMFRRPCPEPPFGADFQVRSGTLGAAPQEDATVKYMILTQASQLGYDAMGGKGSSDQPA